MTIRGKTARAAIFSLAPGLVLALVLALYQAFYTFSFYPITEGWFSGYAALIRAGLMPYRDFSLLMPPLYPLQFAAAQAVFGEGLIAARVAGVLVTCGIGLVLWTLMARFFPRWIAAFASAVATIYYQSGNAFIGYDFTQVLTLYLLLGALFMLLELEHEHFPDAPWWRPSPAFWSGLFLAAATLTKQSNGGLTTGVLAIAFIIVTLRSESLSIGRTRIVNFGAGGLALLLPLLIWLAVNGALPQFFQQVVADALAAKGGDGPIFTGWVAGVFGDPAYGPHMWEMLGRLWNLIALSGGMSLVGAAIWLVMKWRGLSANVARAVRGWLRASAAIIGLSGVAGVIYVATSTYRTGSLLDLAWRDNAALVYNSAILFSVHLYILGTGFCLVWMLLRPSQLSKSLFVLLSLGLGLTIGNGTSAGLSEISAFVGVAVGLAFLCTIAAPVLLPAVVPVGVGLLLCAFLAENKFERPYAWWSVQSGDVRQEVCADTQGLLDHLCIAPDKYSRIMDLAAAVEQATSPGDQVYVFPHEPIFNLLSDRLPYENAVVSWFDFTSLRQGRELIAALESRPPPALVMSRLPSEVFEAHERLFNDGQPGIQREIVAAVDALVASGAMRLSTSTEIDGIPLELYVRVR